MECLCKGHTCKSRTKSLQKVYKYFTVLSKKHLDTNPSLRMCNLRQTSMKAPTAFPIRLKLQHFQCPLFRPLDQWRAPRLALSWQQCSRSDRRFCLQTWRSPPEGPRMTTRQQRRPGKPQRRLQAGNPLCIGQAPVNLNMSFYVPNPRLMFILPSYIRLPLPKRCFRLRPDNSTQTYASQTYLTPYVRMCRGERGCSRHGLPLLFFGNAYMLHVEFTL